MNLEDATLPQWLAALFTGTMSILFGRIVKRHDERNKHVDDRLSHLEESRVTKDTMSEELNHIRGDMAESFRELKAAHVDLHRGQTEILGKLIDIATRQRNQQ